MASISNLGNALDSLAADVNDLHIDVERRLATLTATIASLTAGAISQEQIDSLAAQALAIDEVINSTHDEVQEPVAS